MAKGKPSRAFLEALKQDKKRRGEEKTGGGFKTPEWFFNNSQTQARPEAEAPAPAPVSVTTVAASAGRPKAQFKWAHAAGAIAVVAVLVSISYVAGRQQPTPQLSPPSEQLRESVPQSGVLEPVDRTVATLPPPAHIPVEQPQPVPSQPAAPQSSERIVGMNYFVIQGYPKEHEQLAREASEALRAGGVACSIEHGLRGYRSDWHLVVGYTPFARPSAPECQEYLKRVREIGEKFAGASKWKRFEPLAYKWQ